ncbi:MAG TPA: DNA replication/repair protein RecF [Marmoricola sp.]|nr:DNA replication/repair protein RecF [Marmoricola sp.]
MYVAHLSLHDFRSWPELELDLEPGVTALVGRNGQGKTNVVEAIDYLSRLSSHRVASDLPLVRKGADHAVVRAAVVRDERRAVLEVEINPGKSNRARINRAALPKARELLGLVRTVVFAPDDLALVKGDPTERRRFADDLLVLQGPRYAGTRSDYDRVLKQRNMLLKTARVRGPGAESALSTLEVWDANLARLGAEVMAARGRLVEELTPLLGKAYEAVARGAARDDAHLAYKPSFDPGSDDGDAAAAELEQAMLEEIARRRSDELDRGVSLVGPHRDDLLCTLGELPVKGYASHGEGWSFALAMRLASYELLRSTGDDPILVLDDVFAELDTTRRAQLAELVAGAEQVLVTAAVAEDIPEGLRGRRFAVADGKVLADD